MLSLRVKAQDVAKMYSNPERAFNGNHEVFTVEKIIPLSESVAITIYSKIPSGKQALALFTYINGGEGYWAYCFPTYDHLAGYYRVEELLHDVEVFNFDKN